MGEDYEVVISDNNSSDETKKIIQSFIQKYGNGIKYVFEPRQGRPYALNRAIPICRGEWIWFTDDDVFIPYDFIFKAVNILNYIAKNIVLIGGKVYPYFEGALSDDLKELVYLFPGCFGIHDKNMESESWIGLSEKELDKIRPWGRIYGGNMFVRKFVLDELGGYNVDYTYMQDTELSKRIMLSGYGAMFSSDLSIGHLVSRERVSPDYIKRWYSRRAYIKCLDENWYPPKWHHIKGMPLSVLISFIIFNIFYNLPLLSIRTKAKIASKLGVIKGTIRCLMDRRR